MAIMQNTANASTGSVRIAPNLEKWYLSINNEYSETLKYLGSLSEMSGKLPDYIGSALNSSFPNGNFPSETLASVLQSVDYLYKNHQTRKVAVSSIAAISDIVGSSCDDYIESIKKSAEDLSAAPSAAKNDCLSTLTPEIASAISLKNKFEYGLRDSFKESLSVYDVSAAKWFYSQNSRNFESPITCFVMGLPAGFTNNLKKMDVTLDKSGKSTSELRLWKNPSMLSAVINARAMSRPYDEVNPKAIAFFHPYVHTYIASAIDSKTNIFSLLENGVIAIKCYDVESGVWVDSSYQDCIEFLTNNASFAVSDDSKKPIISTTVAKEIILHHAYDAILKSTIRVVAGLDLKESSFNTTDKKIGSNEAKTMLSMFAQSTIIPRGTMTASQFLSQNADGTYSSIPYSHLSGEAPNKTNPSDHSLLLKLLDSGIFTSSTAHERIITPDAFERVYCALYDPRNLNFTSVNDRNAIPLISLSAFSIKAE